MSFPERREGPRREQVSSTIAGFMAAGALFTGLGAIVYYPGRLGPGAMLIALIASAIGGAHRRLAAISLVVVTVSWLIGMILAITFERPLF